MNYQIFGFGKLLLIKHFSSKLSLGFFVMVNDFDHCFAGTNTSFIGGDFFMKNIYNFVSNFSVKFVLREERKKHKLSKS